jgi:hypothetical protein
MQFAIGVFVMSNTQTAHCWYKPLQGMKKVFPIFLFFYYAITFSQNDASSFKQGEYLKYKIQYGLLNAGMASVEIKNGLGVNDSLFHTVGKGWTTGMVHFLFPTEDVYESYFYEKSLRPKHFIRKISEGGYTQDKEIYFDFEKHQAKVINHKKETENSYFIQNNVQDMLSSFYYMRRMDFSNLKQNDSIDINMFFDEKMYPIKLIILDREIIKTNFGKIKTIKIRPLVQKGRIFKDEENVTLWISDDLNKIPLKIKASLIVGSAKAELIEYNGLVHPFP